MLTEGPVLWPPDVKSQLIRKDSDAGKDWGQKEKGTTEDEMVGWHCRLNGHEFEQVPGDGEGQGSLACCGPWGCKQSDATGQLNNKESLGSHIHWVGDAIQISHPLSPPSPPALNLFQHQSLFQWVSSSHQVAKVLELQSFSISPSNEYSGLISFRIDWFDLLAVQDTLKSLLQHHSSKASILQCSAFFMVQFSHPQMTTGKTTALTRRGFVGSVSAF